MVELCRLTDIDRLVEWRREVLSSVFGNEPDDALLASNREFFMHHVSNGSHIAVVACRDGAEAGCGAVCFYDEMPSPDNPTGRCAYIMNMYVRKEFRREGIATDILKYLISASRDRKCGKIYLETTDMARNVYSDIGFHNMKDLMKYGD